jgi:CRP-like cAMP-binding protein/thioredoxin reductase/Fe-S-cluster-containing dehydrogenase component
MADHFQIAILGSGPGGLGAATNAAKHGLSHCLIEKSQIANTIYDYQLRKLVMAEPRKLPLRSLVPFEEGSREEILAGFDTALEECGVNVIKGEVKALRKEGDKFHITYNTTEITADNVVLAIGTMGTPRKLGVEGEDLPHIAYTLADPDAFEGKDIIVVGAGDSAIENALGLMEKNSVSLLNRSGEFPRAKDANRAKILDAISSGKIRCFYNTTMARVEEEKAFLNTADGEVEVKCNHIIVRAGSIPPRKFVESCGVEFPSPEMTSFPSVSDSYESNVPGLYIVGALIGYPLIKQAINQGHEVVEHVMGNPVEPADQVLIEEVLAELGGDCKEHMANMRKVLRLFADISTPQFREMVIDSTLHIFKKGDVVFEKNDYTDTFWNVVSGSVGVEAPDDPGKLYKMGPGNFFGEMGLISGRRRTATVRALEDAVLIETKRNQILKLMASAPSVKDAVDQVFFLRALKTSIFPEADPIFLAELTQKAERANFKKGEALFKEGDAGDKLYIILKGSVKISRRNSDGVDVAQTYLPAGNYVGEMALVSDAPRSATVTAVVPCSTLSITEEDFIDLLEKNPETKQSVIRKVEERRIENLTAERDEYSGEVLNFVLSEGVSDAENVLLIDSDLCIGCDNCENACAATHNGYSRLDRKGGKSFASIQLPISCRHCENPLCMLDCPPDALERQPDGEVIIKETCIGCGNCAGNCPYGVIQLVYDKSHSNIPLLDWLGLGKKAKKGPAKAAKCDMCSSMSGGPACVRSCPTGAAVRVNPREMMKLLIDRQENMN